jgi:flavorubredoxin
MEEARKYYANIVLPYGKQVQKVLEAAGGLDIGMIAPSHGLIWDAHLKDILAAYHEWAFNVASSNKALIIYDTMWHSTQKMAYAIADAFENLGIHIRMYNLQENHISDIMTQIITAKYICVGSPTLNSSILPTTAGFLYYLKGLSPKNRVGLAFGSYGWGGQSIDIVHNMLGDPKECGFEMLDPIRVQYIPDEETLQNITKKVETDISKHR